MTTSPRLPLPIRAVLTLVAMLAASLSSFAAVLLPSGTGQRVVAHLCSALAGIGLAILLVRAVDRRPVAALGLGRPAWKASLAALAVTAACAATGSLLASALGLTTPTPTSMWGPMLAGVLTILTQSFLLQAIPEEVLFRGYLVQSALGQLPLWGVTALSVLVFGVPHLISKSGATSFGQQVIFLLMPIGFALLATVFRIRTGSVWPAVMVHGGFHISWAVSAIWITPRPESYGAFLAVFGGVFLAAGLAATALLSGHRTSPQRSDAVTAPL